MNQVILKLVKSYFSSYAEILHPISKKIPIVSIFGMEYLRNPLGVILHLEEEVEKGINL